MYKIEYCKQPIKFLKNIPKLEREKIQLEIESLAKNPRKHGVIKLVESDPVEYRTRQGDYRIVFRIEDSILKVVIIRIFSRGDGY